MFALFRDFYLKHLQKILSLNKVLLGDFDRSNRTLQMKELIAFYNVKAIEIFDVIIMYAINPKYMGIMGNSVVKHNILYKLL